jgi:cysteine-rich repeat protein
VSGCLSDDEVLAFVLATVSEANIARIERHIDECASCRFLVAEAARASLADERLTEEDRAADEAAGVAGVVAGRFVLGTPLGSGALGVVYRARDTHLGRDIAIKLLRPEPTPDLPEAERRNALLEEARAMARLQHPNVVGLYDAGVVAGRVFVAMELVEGGTLAEWLKAEPRPWREIVARFAQAARGLAAAHARGVIHRDFKADNVLLSADGVARVGDFGLARGAPEPLEDGGAPDATTLAGTPLYMAPEQWAGRAADARTDQFSFCVALYRALFGQHPFVGQLKEAGPVPNIRDMVSAGRVLPPPPGARVPARLTAALRRGLSADPAARHPSMDALVTTLDATLTDRGRVPAWARWAAAAAVVAAAGWGIVQQRSKVPRDRCGDGRVTPGIEECDDGNDNDADGCTRSCLRCAPGPDEVVWGNDPHCYTRQHTAMGWDDAQRACAATGGYLAVISSDAEWNGLQPHFFGRGVPGQWWGARDLNGKGHFGSITAEPPPTDLRYFFRTATLARGTCIAQGRHFEALDCATPRSFICERAPWVRRPETGHAYRGVYAVGTWFDAERACRHMGAHLATLGDAQESAFATSTFTGTLWVGARRPPNQAAFAWTDGERFGYTRFGEGEPNVKQWDGACIALSVDGFWHDRECPSTYDGTLDGPYGALCELDR